MRLLSSPLLVLLAGVALALPVPPVSDSALALEARESRRSISINSVLSLITQLFPVNIAVTDISGLITTAEEGLADALDIDTTENGLSGSCASMTIVFARGTTETGNVGAVAGPEFFDAVQQALGSGVSLAVQGVDYPATVDGFLAGGDAQGSQTMADDVQKAFQQCPQTKVVMAGYSQGGQLVHNAAKILGASTMSEVNSVVIFGDPDNGEAVTGVAAAKTMVICHDGDNICQQGDLILPPHLTYAVDAAQAAAFVASHY